MQRTSSEYHYENEFWTPEMGPSQRASFPRITFGLGTAIIVFGFLVSSLPHIAIYYFQTNRFVLFLHYTLGEALSFAIIEVLLVLLFAPFFKIIWNILVTRAFGCPKLTYMHAALITFLYICVRLVGG